MDLNEPAKTLFDSISSYNKLEELINDGQTETLYLEAKSPQHPSVGKGVKNHLADALSGFSNTEGGVMLFGVSTSNRFHSGVDSLVQIEPISNISNFARQIENIIPTLTAPNITRYEVKLLFKKKTDSAGVLLLLIPKLGSKPVQALYSYRFMFRSGDNFIDAPYTVIEGLFSSGERPLLATHTEDGGFDLESGLHKLGVVLNNESLVSAKEVQAFLEIKNSQDVITSSMDSNWSDASSVNSKKITFSFQASSNIYYSLGLHAGNLSVQMKPRKRKLVLELTVFADKMVPRIHQIILHLTQRSMAVKQNKVDTVK
jgi:hypothetical protein